MARTICRMDMEPPGTLMEFPGTLMEFPLLATVVMASSSMGNMESTGSSNMGSMAMESLRAMGSLGNGNNCKHFARGLELVTLLTSLLSVPSGTCMTEPLCSFIFSSMISSDLQLY